MEKKVTCNGDCERCIYPDCIATDKEIAEFNRAERNASKHTSKKYHKSTDKIKPGDMYRLRKNAMQREYYSRHKEERIEYAKKWNAEHREDIRDYNCLWMKAYRAKQKEAAV